MARPIPLSLLNDVITLMAPTTDGYDSTEIYDVRVQKTSAVREYNSSKLRDISEITVYYDCQNSSPRGVDFIAGMLIMYEGERYEILSAEQFASDRPHHVRITARSV